MAKADKLPHVSIASDNTVFTHSVFLFLLSVEIVVVNTTIQRKILAEYSVIKSATGNNHKSERIFL